SAVSGPPANTSGGACTTADGSYSIPLLTGTYSVSITTSAGAICSRPGPSYSTSMSGVVVSTDTVLNFTLPPIFTLFGRIANASGTGVGGVNVSAQASPPTSAFGSTATAADASYSLPLYSATYNIQLSI